MTPAAGWRAENLGNLKLDNSDIGLINCSNICSHLPICVLIFQLKNSLLHTRCLLSYLGHFVCCFTEDRAAFKYSCVQSFILLRRSVFEMAVMTVL